MKKLIPVILLIISLPAFAQRNNVDKEHENFFRFGAKGGVNINKISCFGCNCIISPQTRILCVKH